MAGAKGIKRLRVHGILLMSSRPSSFLCSEKMDSAKQQPASSFSSLARTVTKILRFRHAATGSGRGFDNQKRKPAYSEFSDSKEKRRLESPCSDSSTSREVDMESLLGNIFAGVSAIKAAYSQLQVAESPYDPDTIQASDEAVVSELKRLSELKQSYLKQQRLETKPLQQKQNTAILTARLQEQRNLLKTYQITSRKLESGLRHKDAEIDSLHAQFLNSERYNRSLESRLRLLTSPDNLHIPAALNPMHFVAELRLAVKSVRTFVKQMMREMESAGWDLDAAATVIQPDVRGKPDNWIHAFESFVCRRMFSDFGRGRSSWDYRRFFREFVAMRSAKPEEGGAGEMGIFIREKYLALVHPKMEASVIGNLNRRGAKRSVRSEFSALFTEMARRVWLLRCLYCSYGPETEAMIFEAKRGERFSDVYMESVVSPVASPAALTVAFTVVPGFRVGNTLIQCKVCLSSKCEEEM